MSKDGIDWKEESYGIACIASNMLQSTPLHAMSEEKIGQAVQMAIRIFLEARRMTSGL
jgi:hypothetical protein